VWIFDANFIYWKGGGGGGGGVMTKFGNVLMTGFERIF